MAVATKHESPEAARLKRNISFHLNRLLAGRTPTWLASKLGGHHKTTIHRAVRGQFLPRLDLLTEMARIFAVPVEQLYADPPQKNLRKTG